MIRYLTKEEFLMEGYDDDPSLDIYIKRANLEIYRLTKINSNDFVKLSHAQQEMVKMAAIDQTLFLSYNGVEGVVSGGKSESSSVSIGKYSESAGSGGGSKSSSSSSFSPSAYQWLLDAGVISTYGYFQGGSWYGSI